MSWKRISCCCAVMRKTITKNHPSSTRTPSSSRLSSLQLVSKLKQSRKNSQSLHLCLLFRKRTLPPVSVTSTVISNHVRLGELVVNPMTIQIRLIRLLRPLKWKSNWEGRERVAVEGVRGAATAVEALAGGNGSAPTGAVTSATKRTISERKRQVFEIQKQTKILHESLSFPTRHFLSSWPVGSLYLRRKAPVGERLTVRHA